MLRAALRRKGINFDGALALGRTNLETCSDGPVGTVKTTAAGIFNALNARIYSTAGNTNQSQPQKDVPLENKASAGAEKAAESLSAIPTLPKFLGLGGLIPFVALSAPIAGSIPLVSPEFAVNAAILQVGYGATIASFLGGIHWSLAMVNYGNASAKANNDRYLWSVMPCLAAWPALGMETGPGALVVASTLVGAYLADRSFTRRGLLPPWYMGLRLPLTLVAASSLLVTCAYSFTARKRSSSSRDTMTPSS